MALLHARNALAMLVVGVAAAACSTTTPTTPPPGAAVSTDAAPVSPARRLFEKQFAWSTAAGEGGISGTVAYTPKTRESWGCAGQTVGLTPETAYTRDRMTALYGSASLSIQPIADVKTRSNSSPGEDYGKYVRSAVCDADNRFEFKNLPNGGYFIIAVVQRVRPKSDGADHSFVIMQRVQVTGGAPAIVTVPVSQPPAS